MSYMYVAGRYSVNTADYGPIFPYFVDNFPDLSLISLPYFPILCKLDNLIFSALYRYTVIPVKAVY